MTDALGLREEVAEVLHERLHRSVFPGEWPCPAPADCYQRILAYHLADALLPPIERREAEAWDGGYGSGFSNAMRRMSDEPNAPTTPNPYRSPTMQHDTEGGAA